MSIMLLLWYFMFLNVSRPKRWNMHSSAGEPQHPDCIDS